MKIYKLNTQDDGVTCIYSDKNKFSCLGFQRHYGSYMDAGERFQDWDILHFYMNSSINKKKKVYNIMHHNLLFVIVDEQSKIAIQEKYSNCIQFLEAVNDDDPLTKYYFMYPFRGVEGLDLDKSECRFIEETRIYTTVYKYVFNNNIKYYPVFLLKTEGAIYDMRMYATDEFKEFIESNGITGLRFEEIFDFED